MVTLGEVTGGGGRARVEKFVQRANSFFMYIFFLKKKDTQKRKIYVSKKKAANFLYMQSLSIMVRHKQPQKSTLRA